MKRSTHLMIGIVYYMSQLLGVLAFSYNYDTGKLQTTIGITIYSCMVSVLMFCSLPILFRVQWKPRNVNGPELHYKINALMCLLHIVAVLITVLLNWSKRKEYIRTIRDFQHARNRLLQKFVMSDKVQQYFEKSIRSKFYWGLMYNIITFVASYDILRGIFDIESPIIIMGLGAIATVLNIIMTHYFFALLNVNVLLAVINEELKRILNTSSQLFKLQRLKQIKPGILITTCCQLADELQDLAINQYNLQNIGDRVNRMYDLQGSCVVLTLYMNNISVIYMTYMMLLHEELSQDYGTITVMIIMPIAVFFYYMDLRIFTESMLNFGDCVKNTKDLLKNLQHCLPTLDERFEKSHIR
ncbi:putative gustatory receptor 59d [Calliphora vicina]|uniref:putative gustatory receptor 59d n=1 Tax=Calliphora vicina TaxID=7373 RepID=UPI00325BAD7A